MDIPVYLFTGFLEAGKTSFILETLRDPSFLDPKKKYLVITCEEGIEEYYPDELGENVSFASFDSQETITPDRLSAMQKRAKADLVVIEYNGMWQIDRLYNALPENWLIYQEILVMDATTALTYNANMRQLVVDKLTSAEMVFFNRVKPEYDKMELHKLVRGISRRANICYEDTNGQVEFDEYEDPLPFDINSPVIDIKDVDFAIFYRDMSEDFAKYKGKTVRFKGIVALDPSLPTGHYAIGRHIMTCCADDIAYRGVVAKGTGILSLKTRDWVIVEGTLNEEYSKLYRAKGPVLTVTHIERATVPEQEVATFY